MRWCRAAVVEADGGVLVRFAVTGTGRPDLSVVDDVARLALASTRLGCRLLLSDVAPGLRELLELAGLWVQVQGEAEGGEQPLGLQECEEEAERGDLSL
jgi:hypothetical protein